MPRIYIPEISDVLRLEEPWTFELFNESRNREVWNALDGNSHPSLAANRARVAEIDVQLAEIDARKVEHQEPYQRWVSGGAFSHGRYEPAMRTVRSFSSMADQVEHGNLYTERHALCSTDNMFFSVTLPVGTELKVDRIYIRKGKGDYSSITFYIQSCPMPELSPSTPARPGFKKGKKRFWAKHYDVNTMVAETVIA